MPRDYRFSRWSALLLTIILVSGCDAANMPAPRLAAEPSAAAAQSAATRTIQHALGTTEVPATPQRVVVLDTGELDTVLALGVKPVGAVEAIAGEGYQAYFGNLTEGITPVGTIAEPSLETIALLDPDLILSNKVRHEAIYEQLAQIAPTVFAERVGVVWKDNFKLHAAALGKAAEAEQMMQQYNQRVAALQAQLGDPAATEVSVVRFLPEHLRLYQRGSFIGTILDDIGFARPASQQATDETWLEGNQERIGDLDGDKLFVTYYGDETAAVVDAFKADPLWSQLRAVQTNNVYDVADDHWMLGIGILAANKVLDDIETLLVDVQ